MYSEKFPMTDGADKQRQTDTVHDRPMQANRTWTGWLTWHGLYRHLAAH